MQDTYLERNRGFITSHKLQSFMRCQFCYAQKYVNGIPDPYEDAERKECFLIGQAFDDMITYPDDFAKNYEVMKRRTGKTGKIEITEGQNELIGTMLKEYRANKLFSQEPKKHVIETKISGFNVRCELDGINKERQMIEDIKTTANITKFDPMDYVFQMAFYQMCHEEISMERYAAQLYVVDKNSVVSRSASFIFSPVTLFSERGRILDALMQLKEAEDTGIYLPANDQMTLFNCPYYGYKGHGRPTQPLMY